MSRFIPISDARTSSGLRMVALRGVPSPWTEAAKGIFHVKQLDCQYAAAAKTDAADALVSWAGDSTVPVVAYEKEPLRTGWAEILILAERLAPETALIPAATADRVKLFGLAHEICGEMGLGWCLRLQMLKLSMGHGAEGAVGFAPQVAASLAAKYGFIPQHVAQAKSRVLEILAFLDQTLGERRYLIGNSLTAADIYWATFANLLTPLPEELLPAHPTIRAIYSGAETDLVDAMTPRLRDHQTYIYQRYLELPVPL
jgi:glutathione S-transferase